MRVGGKDIRKIRKSREDVEVMQNNIVMLNNELTTVKADSSFRLDLVINSLALKGGNNVDE